MTCQKCRTKIDTQGRHDTIEYCPECGAFLAKTCQHCEGALKEVEHLCSLCGTLYDYKNPEEG